MKQRKMKKEKVENCLTKKECKLKHSIYIITFLQPLMNVLITITDQTYVSNLWNFTELLHLVMMEKEEHGRFNFTVFSFFFIAMQTYDCLNV